MKILRSRMKQRKFYGNLGHKGGFYWAGAYATDKYVVFGSDDGTGESNAESAVLYSVNPLNGAVISKITGLKGDIRSSITYQDGYVYFTTKGGMLYRVAIDENGTLGEVRSFDMGTWVPEPRLSPMAWYSSPARSGRRSVQLYRCGLRN